MVEDAHRPAVETGTNSQPIAAPSEHGNQEIEARVGTFVLFVRFVLLVQRSELKFRGAWASYPL